MITLYSNDCPKCKILKLKLKDKNIEYNLCSDIDTMISKGFQAMPKLEVNEAIMDFADALNWVKEQ